MLAETPGALALGPTPVLPDSPVTSALPALKTSGLATPLANSPKLMGLPSVTELGEDTGSPLVQSRPPVQSSVSAALSTTGGTSVVGEGAWEVKESDVEVSDRIGGGSYGDIFKGRLWGTDIAVKLIVAAVLTEEVHVLLYCCFLPPPCLLVLTGVGQLQSRSVHSRPAAPSECRAVHWRMHSATQCIHRHRVV